MTKRHIAHDVFLFFTSIVLAFFIVEAEIVSKLLVLVGGSQWLVSFIAGMFFTSLFTTAPALVILGELSQSENIFLVALIGGLGSMVGDYLLFWFVKNHLTTDLSLISEDSHFRRVARILKRNYFHRILPIVGVLFLISPLPDEPALALLGLSSISSRSFLLLSFLTHAAGILVVGFLWPISL